MGAWVMGWLAYVTVLDIEDEVSYPAGRMICERRVGRARCGRCGRLGRLGGAVRIRLGEGNGCWRRQLICASGVRGCGRSGLGSGHGGTTSE